LAQAVALKTKLNLMFKLAGTYARRDQPEESTP